MKTEPKLLHLTLRKEPFDQILSGEKTSEYREYKQFWITRLMNNDGSFKHYDVIHFKNGYHKDAPTMLVEFKGIKIISDFGSRYFEIELGRIIDLPK